MRAGIEKIRIKGIFYEIPENVILYKTDNGNYFYISGCSTKYLNNIKKDVMEAHVLQTDRYIEGPLKSFDKYFERGCKIINLFEEDYEIPFIYYDDIIAEINSVKRKEKIYFKKIIEKIKKYKI